MNWFVALLLLPALVLMRVLGGLTDQNIRMRGWQMVLVSFGVYASVVVYAVFR